MESAQPQRPWNICLTRQCSVADILVGIGLAGILLAVIFALRSEHGQPPGAVSGGKGTPDNPYRIANCRELQNIADVPAAAYVLLRDIDCSATAQWNGGAGFFPIGYYDYGFSGMFDGAGHMIRGLTINRPSTDYLGLFGKTDVGSVVRDITVEADVRGRDYVGGVVGWAVGGSFTNVYVQGRVKGRSGVGGLAGVSQGGLQDTSADVRVQGLGKWIGGLVGWNYTRGVVDGSSDTGDVDGDEYVGGLAGVSHGGFIRKSFASGNVKGRESVGGLVGYVVGNDENPSIVRNCYASGIVSGTSKEGEVVGWTDDNAVVEECFSLRGAAPEPGR
ncbi:MAG: GLUG motif-containing protein [Candidatus Peribacteraceae bacterium]